MGRNLNDIRIISGTGDGAPALLITIGVTNMKDLTTPTQTNTVAA